MKKILQVIKDGLIPEHLEAYVDSVKRFSDRSKVEYVLITNCEIDYKINKIYGAHELSNIYLWNRTWSELVRLKYLSENEEVLYADYDEFLYKGFICPDIETISNQTDDLIYNHKNTERYKRIYNIAKDKIWKAADIISGPALRSEIDYYMINKFDMDTYRHTSNSYHHFTRSKPENYVKIEVSNG